MEDMEDTELDTEPGQESAESPEPESEPESGKESEPETSPGQETEPEPETKTESEPETETGSEPESEAKTGSEPETETETESEPESRTESGIQTGTGDAPASGTDMQITGLENYCETMTGYADSINHCCTIMIGLTLAILLCTGITCGCMIAHSVWSKFH